MKFSSDPLYNFEQLQNLQLPAGWCRTDEIKRHSFIHPQLDRGLPFAISLIFPLNNEIINSIEDQPNLLYQQHYRIVNIRLELEVLRLAGEIQACGFRALPVPVSVSVEPLKGHLSHRMVGMLSGMGWIGKSALLISPEYNARLRLVTVLTDLPLPEYRKRLENRCGDCRLCLDICPVKAIKEEAKNIDRKLCYNYIKSLVHRQIVDEMICGLCVKVCDGGAKSR